MNGGVGRMEVTMNHPRQKRNVIPGTKFGDQIGKVVRIGPVPLFVSFVARKMFIPPLNLVLVPTHDALWSP